MFLFHNLIIAYIYLLNSFSIGNTDLEYILSQYYKAINQSGLNKVESLEMSGNHAYYFSDSASIGQKVFRGLHIDNDRQDEVETSIYN